VLANQTLPRANQDKRGVLEVRARTGHGRLLMQCGRPQPHDATHVDSWTSHPQSLRVPELSAGSYVGVQPGSSSCRVLHMLLCVWVCLG
jgi:hypothetical protein